MKPTHDKSAAHPTEIVLDDPHAGAVTPETAARLLARLQLTEGEALALLAAPQATEAEVHDALKAEVHAIAAAFPPATVHALTTDPKLEIGREFAAVPEAAARVAEVSSALDKLGALVDDAHASTRVDTGLLQGFVYSVMPQLKARARLNKSVRHTYSGLFAYHHARNPGGHARTPSTTGPTADATAARAGS